MPSPRVLGALKERDMRAINRATGKLKIGHRLAAAFAVCGALIAAAAYLGLSSQSRSDQLQQDINEVAVGQQVGDDLLVSVNDVTGWQGLYLADAAAFGVQAALGKDGYNRAGFDEARENVDQVFARADLSGLTSDEKAVLTEIETHFEQFFAEDEKIRAMLRADGVDALPGIMRSVNGGEAGAAWSAVYDAVGEFNAKVESRVQKLNTELRETKESGRRAVYVGLALAATAAVTLLGLVISSITRPLRRSVLFIKEMAEGRLDGRLPVESRDEIGVMAMAVNEAMESLSAAFRGMDTTPRRWRRRRRSCRRSPVR
jgi:methyl-accepting chemotaxis protein